jgi:hypothetical protein
VLPRAFFVVEDEGDLLSMNVNRWPNRRERMILKALMASF